MQARVVYPDTFNKNAIYTNNNGNENNNDDDVDKKKLYTESDTDRHFTFVDS